MPHPKDKQKFALWLFPETLGKVTEMYRQDDCVSRSEFIEKAIRFYIGYLTAENKSNYLPNIFLSNMHSAISESDTRISRMLFKLSVEMAMVMNILAGVHDIDPDSVDKLRGECVKEVKRLNGQFSLENAIDWQKG